MSKKVPGILCAALLGIVTIVTVTCRYSDTLLENSARAQRQLLCKDIGRQVGSIFELAHTAVYLASAFPQVINAADPLIGKNERAQAGKQLETFFRQLRAGSPFPLPFTLLDSGGNILAGSAEDEIRDTAPLAHDALQGRFSMQGPYVSKETDEAVLILAEPVLRDRRVVGILAGHLDPQQLSIAAMRALSGSGTAHAFALDASGRVVLHSSRPDLVGISFGEEAWTRELLRRKEGEISYEWADAAHIASFTLLPKPGWIVAVSFPEEEASAVRSGIRNRMLVCAALIVLLLLLASWLLLKSPVLHLRKACDLALEELKNDGDADGQRMMRELGRAAFAHHALSAALDRLRRSAAQIQKLDDLHREKLHAALNGISDGVLELDANADVRFANPAALAALGRKAEETLGRNIRSVLSNPRGEADTLLPLYEACFRGQTFNPANVFLRGRDERPLLLELSAVPLRRNETPDGTLLTLRDTTFAADRRETLTALTRAAGGVYFIWDEQLKLVECAEVCASFFRIASKEEMLYAPERFMPALQANGRSSAAELERRLLTALRTGQESYEWLFQDGQGEHIPCEVIVRRLTLGGRTALLGLARDVRLLRAAEVTLAGEHAKLEQVLDALPVAVGITGRGTLHYANHALEEFLSRHGNEPDLAPFSPMLPSDAEAAWRPVGNRFLQFIGDDGAVRDYTLSCFPMEYNGAAALFGWIIDITQIKNEHHECIRDKERAVAAVQEKEQALVLLDRELREPINNVLFALQQALKSATETDRGHAVNTAYAAGRQLLEVLGYLLHMSGVDALSLHPEMTRFAPEKIFRDSLDAVTDNAAMQGVTLTWTCDQALPAKLVGDSLLLRRILTRILANAIKYTPSGGSVHAAITRLPTNRLNRAVAHIMVADSGLGMSDAKTAALLNSPPQIGGADAAYEAAGFALSMICGYVKLMGGGMCILSEPGRGTEVHLTLPFALELLEEDELAPEENRLPFLHARDAAVFRGNSKARILVVDDLLTNRQIVTLILQKMGYDAVGADSGPQALSLLESEHFDLVFMDIQMPEMNGIDVTLRIRNDDTGRWPRAVPIVAMTAHAMLGDPEKYIAAGMNDYLSKPVIIEDLANILRNILGTG